MMANLNRQQQPRPIQNLNSKPEIIVTKDSTVTNTTETIESIDERDSQLYTMEEMNENLEDQLINHQNGRPLSIDMPSLISMEILESHGHGRIQTKSDQQPQQNVDQVLQNVNEMNRILNDTEKYFIDQISIDNQSKSKSKSMEMNEKSMLI